MNDILDSLKVRINSPLIISFIISWPFWNWQIMLALIWYNGANLEEKTGCKNYINLVNEYSNWYDSLAYPLCSALAYTFLFPLVKWGISAFNAWISTKENNNILKITNTENIPTEIFLQKSKEAKERIKELSDIIKDESAKHEENAKLISENSKLSIDLKKLEKQIEQSQIDSDLKVRSSKIGHLDGKWDISILNKETNVEFREIVHIQNGGVDLRENSALVFQFQIKNYIYNPITNFLSLVFLLEEDSMITLKLRANRVVITEAMMIDDSIESTNGNISRFLLKMKKIDN